MSNTSGEVKASTRRLYVVKEAATGKEVVVEAVSPAAALKEVIGGKYEVFAASAYDVKRVLGGLL